MLVASTAARTDVDSVVGREPAGIASFWKPLQQHPLALQCTAMTPDLFKHIH